MFDLLCRMHRIGSQHRKRRRDVRRIQPADDALPRSIYANEAYTKRAGHERKYKLLRDDVGSVWS